MEKFIKPLANIIDVLTEEKITRLNRINPLLTLDYQNDEYRNLAIDCNTIYEAYLVIRRQPKNRKTKPNSVTVVDFGSGIGNVLTMFNQLIMADKILFPNLVDKQIYGAEKIPNYIMNTMAGNVSRIDLSRTKELKDFISQVKTNELNIWWCNRPFKSIDLQHNLEISLIENAPKGTFICNPMGFSVLFKEHNVNVINKTLIVKM